MPSPGWMGWSFMAFCMRVDSVVFRESVSCHPMLTVSEPCGSTSTSNTFLPSIAKPIPRFSQVVVLAVPPFWFTMAIVVAFFAITSPTFGEPHKVLCHLVWPRIFNCDCVFMCKTSLSDFCKRKSAPSILRKLKVRYVKLIQLFTKRFQIFVQHFYVHQCNAL